MAPGIVIYQKFQYATHKKIEERVFNMAVSLQKGQKVDLTKNNPGLQNIIVGLGWDTNKYDGGKDFDLDASVFLVNSGGKVASDQDFVFYGNKEGGSGSVVHSGDNRTGEGEGDDEQIKINLGTVPSEVEKISFTITIHEAEIRNQNFGQVSNAYVRVLDATGNEELIRYDLGEDFSIETAIVVADLYRHGSEWKFNAIGSGFSGGLSALCRNFGLEIA
jgi:tellurium resistance protein TerD